MGSTQHESKPSELDEDRELGAEELGKLSGGTLGTTTSRTGSTTTRTGGTSLAPTDGPDGSGGSGGSGGVVVRGDGTDYSNQDNIGA